MTSTPASDSEVETGPASKIDSVYLNDDTFLDKLSNEVWKRNDAKRKRSDGISDEEPEIFVAEMLKTMKEELSSSCSARRALSE